ncbi:hypothetical protein EJ04DRAFT_528781 [Polyplosphaeria fusca]|uniref:AN1-type zinc finger protein n=1 Tax=Polyplosphaeria fusca TaxID=682080 RepID=A0A9P4QJ45_9PLEO|nr:hypothetical protein EJ04DRAFT_528781 [Polyplosphaeria fusca]
MQRTNSTTSTSSSTSATAPSPSADDTIQIFVKDVSGQNTIPLSLPTSTTISTLRTLLSLRLPTTSSSPRLRLVHAGTHLSSPTSTLSSYSIPPNSTIHMTLPLRGGGPKKVRCGFKECRDAAQRIVGDCGFCGGKYCGKHRLLEDHRCEGLEDCKKESHERNAERLERERTVAIKGI